MLEETWSKKQQDRKSSCWLLLFTSNIIINTKTSAGRSRISSKLIFASCVGYFDRVYNGFYVTPSRMLVLIEGNKIWQLWNSMSVQIRSMWLWICVRPYLYLVLVRRNIISSSMTRGDKWSCITRWTLYHTRTAILLSTVSHEPSDIILTCTWAVGHYFIITK